MTDAEWDFGAVLREGRESAGMSQTELARRMDASRNTVLNWESNRSRPSLEDTRRLCRLLRLNPQELMGQETAGRDERRMMTAFRSLKSEEDRHMACALVETVAREAMARRVKALKERYGAYPVYDTPAAAGPGCAFGDGGKTTVFAGKRPGADLLVRVSGRSMEPAYHDRDLVYLHLTQEARPGWDVVCSTDDGAVIKRVDERGRLFSVNADLPFGEHYEDDAVHVIGRVLGRVTDCPEEDDMTLLKRLFGSAETGGN